jgi:hypothetical protein
MSKEQESTEGTYSKDEEKTKAKYTTRQNTLSYTLTPKKSPL